MPIRFLFFSNNNWKVPYLKPTQDCIWRVTSILNRCSLFTTNMERIANWTVWLNLRKWWDRRMHDSCLPQLQTQHSPYVNPAKFRDARDSCTREMILNCSRQCHCFICEKSKMNIVVMVVYYTRGTAYLLFLVSTKHSAIRQSPVWHNKVNSSPKP